MKRKDLLVIAFVLFAVIIGAAMRLIDSVPNFAPIGAIALFSGAFISRKWLAFVLPLGALLLSDLLIEFLEPGAGLHSTMAFVYGAYAVAVAIGFYIKDKINITNTLGGALGASLLFFAITNFGVWLVSGMYPLNFGGLLTCYELAIPFYRATLLSDVIYSGIFFGSFYLLNRRIPSLKKIKVYSK